MSRAENEPRMLHLLGEGSRRDEVLETSSEGNASKRARLILRIQAYFGCDEAEAERQVQRFSALFRGRPGDQAGPRLIRP